MKEEFNLYFYHKLKESNPMFDQNSSPLKQESFNLLSYIYKKALNSLTVIFSIFKCTFLKKNKILFFNHTQRVRKNSVLSKSPLYLNEAIFNKNDFYYIEDNPNKISFYNAPKAILNISIINEFISILTIPSRILNKLKHNPVDIKDIYFYWKMYFWIMILKILKPKKIVLVVWYAYQPIIMAAKKLKIKTIDLQHGLIYSDHEFYNVKKIPSYFIKNNTLPNECWVYGTYWKKQLLKGGWEENKVKIFGYYLNVPLKGGNNSTSPYILYTTSCNANKKEIINHINSIIDEVKKRNLKIIISPHPHENKNNYKDILSDVIILSNKDSYELLKDCQVHISSISTLLWEGLYFEKPTYILNFNLYKNHISILKDLIKNNFARSIKDGEFPEIFNLESDLKINDFFNPIEKAIIKITN
jgi:hypothetical protein